MKNVVRLSHCGSPTTQCLLPHHHPVPAGLLAAGVLDEALFGEFREAAFNGTQREWHV